MNRTIDISIKIGSVERTYNVTFPKVGQYIQVEARKAQLTVPRNSLFDSSTQYLNMIKQGTLTSNLALDLVDMVAWFEICIPDLMKNVISNDITSIEDLDIVDAQPLLDVYKNKFKPWQMAWEKVLQGIGEEEPKKTEEELVK